MIWNTSGTDSPPPSPFLLGLPPPSLIALPPFLTHPFKVDDDCNHCDGHDNNGDNHGENDGDDDE